MNIKSIILLQSVIRLLVQSLEILNRIPEDDYKEVVLFSRSQASYIKGVRDNIERGNVFMAIFFIREILESNTNK